MGGWGSVGRLVGRCHQVVQSSTGSGLFFISFQPFLLLCLLLSFAVVLCTIGGGGDNHFNLKVPGRYVDELVIFIVENCS